MDSRIDEDSTISALVSKCPWPAGSTDARLLFGSDSCYLPWGWQLDQDGVYTDLITRQRSTDPPRVPAIEENFTLKTIGGQVCLQEINAFARRWRDILPSDLHSPVDQALDRVRAAANVLILCGAGDRSLGHCDLDAGLAASRIILKYPDRNDDQQREVSKQLEILSTSTWCLLRMIKGFCVVLQDIDVEVARSSARDVKDAWRSAGVDGYSLGIARFCSESQVSDAVKSLKARLDNKFLSEKATSVAERYHSSVEATRQRLDQRSAQTPWRAEVVAVKWNQRLPHISRLSTFSLYPESTVQLQLQYVDDGAYRRGPTTKWFSTSFVFDDTDDGRHRRPGTRRLVTEPSEHVVELDMRECEIGKEYSELEKCHWMNLLSPGPLQQVHDVNALQWADAGEAA